MTSLALAGLVVFLSAQTGLPTALAGNEAARPTMGTGGEFDREPLPLTLWDEPREKELYRSDFWLGPAVGFLTAHGADHGTWFAGAQARLALLPILAVEGAITFHQNDYEGGDIVVTQYPVQVTGLLYPFPDWPVRPYALAGAGWYYTRTHYRGMLATLFHDQTTHTFGGHVGAGLEARLGPAVSLDADLRYIFMNPDVDGLKTSNFDYWQITAGLNFYF